MHALWPLLRVIARGSRTLTASCIIIPINVSETHYCHIHGEYYGQGCPSCRDDQEKAESRATERFYEAQEEAERRAEEAAYQFANPGDYTCPFCRFKTLLMDASRCPKCHGIVPESYWVEVEARRKARAARESERRAAEEARKAREREEWIRREPERRATAAAQAAKDAAEKAAEASTRKRRRWGWAIILFAFFVVLPQTLHYFATKDQREAYTRALKSNAESQARQNRLTAALGTAKAVEHYPGETVSIFAPVGEAWIKLCKPAHFLLPVGVQYYGVANDGNPLGPFQEVTKQDYYINHEPEFIMTACYYLRSLGDKPLEIKVRFPK